MAGPLVAGCTGDGLPKAKTCAVDFEEPETLVADGTVLRDDRGRRVLLRGVNAGGRSKFAPYAPFDYAGVGYDTAVAEYLDRAETWGVDVLRVPFSWEAVEPERDVWDEAFLNRYDALLDAAWERRMWTVVDFHQDIYAEAYCGDGFPAWTLEDPPENHHDCPGWFTGYALDPDVKAAFDAFWANEGGVQDEYREMWSMMATRHADRPGVIGFELINEPSEGNASASTWAPEVLTPFYTEHAALVQGIDPDALVFFDASGVDAVTAETPLERPDGDNLVFAPHYYDPGALFGGQVGSTVDESLGKWAAKGDEWDLPVLVGEFGIIGTHPDLDPYITAVYDALDANDLHGTYWEYSTAEELWNEEDLSLTLADGTERPAVDAVVRPYPRLLGGDPVSSTWERGEGRYTLTFEADGEVSEIVLPRRTYPGEVTVRGRGVCYERRDDRLLVRPTDIGEVTLSVVPK